MKVVVFNGYKYYKQKSGYYQMAETNKRRNLGVERRLHRAVWKFYNGNIPKGYHIHHKDENKDNNDITNLELLSASQHSKIHNKNKRIWWHTEKGKRANKKGVRLAKFWHHSEDGYLWHSEHQKITCQKHIIKEICNECGKEFTTYDDEKRHQINCRKCRDKLLKRKLRLENPEKYKPKVRCVLTCKNYKELF